MIKTLFENNFVAIKENMGYSYLHIVRSNGRLVAILPYRVVNGEQEYLARVEICPAHSLEAATYSITGGVEKNESLVAAAKRELNEESGYTVEMEDFVHLGEVRPSKQSDTIVGLFAVDVSNKEQHAILGDGSRWEQNASVKWVSFEDGLNVVDPLFITALARLRYGKWQ